MKWPTTHIIGLFTRWCRPQLRIRQTVERAYRQIVVDREDFRDRRYHCAHPSCCNGNLLESRLRGFAHFISSGLPLSIRVFSDDCISGHPSTDPLYVAVSPSNSSWSTRSLVACAPALESSYVTRDARSFDTAASQCACHVRAKRRFGSTSMTSPSTTLKSPSATNAYAEPFSRVLC